MRGACANQTSKEVDCLSRVSIGSKSSSVYTPSYIVINCIAIPGGEERTAEDPEFCRAVFKFLWGQAHQGRVIGHIHVTSERRAGAAQSL